MSNKEKCPKCGSDLFFTKEDTRTSSNEFLANLQWTNLKRKGGTASEIMPGWKPCPNILRACGDCGYVEFDPGGENYFRTDSKLIMVGDKVFA